MSSLVVGGTVIKVAVSSPRWTRSDAVDRARAFDNTFRASQTGGAVRVWDFETPPVLASTDGETYKAALSTVASQLCSGDIIALPTMCSAELTDGIPTSVAGEPYVVLSFTLHEQQPAKALLRYAPGDTISGESFSRSTIASYIAGSLAVTSASIDVKRDSHYAFSGGGYGRSLLLEGARTNPLLHANDFSNAAWVKTTMTVGTGIADPAGGTSACTLTATGTDSLVNQELAVGSSIARTGSVWLRRRTGTGNIHLLTPDSSAYVLQTLTGAWTRFSATGSAGTGRRLQLKISTNGDAVDAWCGQLDDGNFPSSEILTTTVAVTRGADSYQLPFTLTPQELTVYVKGVEAGTILEASAGLFALGGSANASLFVFNSGVGYRAVHQTAGSVSSTAAVSPAIGDLVELCVRLYGDGSVQIGQSINVGTEAVAAQSAANPLATSWLTQLAYLGDRNGSTGFFAFQAFKIVAGSRSLQEMRSL